MRRPAGQYLLITAPVAVAIAAALMPTAASPRVVVSGVPTISVPIRVGSAPAPSAGRRAAVSAKPTAAKRPAVTKHKPVTGAASVAPAVPPAKEDLVRVVHVMYARSARSSDTPNGSPCPRATTCSSHGLMPARWPTDSTGRAVIPFAYSDEGRRRARAPDGLMEPALQGAMAQWTHWNSNIVFQNTGATTATFGAQGSDGTCDDGTNLVTWERLDPGVIGEAVMCYDRSGKIVRDTDLALNATQHWERISGTPQSRHSYDIQSILTHELGHWLALEDLYSAQANRQTMSGSTEYGETRKRTPALGDVEGLQSAYPCGAGDTCPRSGIADD